jgi:hypothetical protein
MLDGLRDWLSEGGLPPIVSVETATAEYFSDQDQKHAIANRRD